MTDNQPDSSQPLIEDKPLSVGNVLREKRMGMSLSIADVAHRLKFAPRQIEALEADDFSLLPEITFVRGFVRSYAKLLQLNPEPLLAALPGTPAPAPPLAARSLEEVPFPGASEARKPNIIWLGAASLIVVVAVAFFVWTRGSKPSVPAASKAPMTKQAEAQPASLQPASAVQDTAVFESAVAPPPQAALQPVQQASKTTEQTSKPAQQATKVTEQASKPAQQAAKAVEQTSKPVQQVAAPDASQSSVPPKRPGIIRLEFDEESWVEVRDKDDRVLISRVYTPGSEESLNGKAPFTLAIGRSSAVRLTYKGKAVDLTQHSKSGGVARLTLE